MVDLKAGIVRILDQNSTTVGTGFLVTDDGLVATCAHVVEAALGLPEDKLPIPQGEVKLDFPLLAPGRISTNRATHCQPDREDRRH